MIKFSIIFFIVYLVLFTFTKFYISGIGPTDVVRISLKYYTKKEKIWFVILGLMRVLAIIFVAIDAIILVVRYL